MSRRTGGNVPAPAKRERKLDDISRNDQILLPIERGKFAVHLPREITERRRGEPAKMAAATCHSANHPVRSFRSS